MPPGGKRRTLHKPVLKELSSEVVAAVAKREGALCLMCREDGPSLMVHTFDPAGDLDNLDNHALLCRYCRQSAKDIHYPSASVARPQQVKWR